ncbi:hypothetical protein CC86DRAFT_68512 [Ophiobolus disseminans]|uniref:Uncharacterized protein n=1 Tax=Ophiobolus disseminans TaxID=1469910 RepID=A0A6A6ZQV5_9PLEO|nr:hypothetical protein CC86DRAFT_68512 [Ophiobolus disseminans]
MGAARWLRRAATTEQSGFLACCIERTRPCYIQNLLLTYVAEALKCVPEQVRRPDAVETPLLVWMETLALCYLAGPTLILVLVHVLPFR